MHGSSERDQRRSVAANSKSALPHAPDNEFDPLAGRHAQRKTRKRQLTAMREAARQIEDLTRTPG